MYQFSSSCVKSLPILAFDKRTDGLTVAISCIAKLQRSK